MNNKAQIDLDDLNIAGIVFAVVAFGIGIIVSKSMGSSLVMRIIAGLICAIVSYIVGSKIADG